MSVPCKLLAISIYDGIFRGQTLRRQLGLCIGFYLPINIFFFLFWVVISSQIILFVQPGHFLQLCLHISTHYCFHLQFCVNPIPLYKLYPCGVNPSQIDCQITGPVCFPNRQNKQQIKKDQHPIRICIKPVKDLVSV